MSPLALCCFLLFFFAPGGESIAAEEVLPLREGMKFILYNPLAAITNERAEEISQEFSHHDVLLLPGTQRRAEQDIACARRRLNYHTEYSWGYKNKKNHSAGVSIYLTHRLAKASIVREVLTPPAQLQGRAAGLRLRAQQMDILILIVYIPPRAAKTIAHWVRRYCSGSQHKSERSAPEHYRSWAETSTMELESLAAAVATGKEQNMQGLMGRERRASEARSAS